MPGTRISVRIGPDLRRKLERAASLKGRRPSDLVRHALDEYFKAQGQELSCYDLARKAGVIGSVRKGPSDLATNRKHFKGFGRA